MVLTWRLVRFVNKSPWKHISPTSNLFLAALLQISLTVLFCEYFIYYIVIFTCSWPALTCGSPTKSSSPLKAMVLGDTHLLGKDAHWLDKLRREWQMTRSFQTADSLHKPDVVFVLGDILDDGQNAVIENFEADVERFHVMFASRAPVICAVGNHDIGFHYRIIPQLRQRFEKAFSARAVELRVIAGMPFVLINSMAFEADGCTMCKEAEVLLDKVSHTLKCLGVYEDKGAAAAESCQNLSLPTITPLTRPIVLQHFPLFRTSDEECHEPDEAPEDEKAIKFREKWECLSKEASDKIIAALEPRAVFDGHTHHGCYRKHDNGVDEWTISSFNWRNKINPAFLIVAICPDTLAVRKCLLPNEHTVFLAYGLSGTFLFIWLTWRLCSTMKRYLKVRLE